MIREDTAREGDLVTINEATDLGKNIRKAGIDFREGDVLLKGGARLSDRDLSLAASTEPSDASGAATPEDRAARHR